MVQGSNPGRAKRFFSSKPSRPPLAAIQPPIWWLLGSFPEGNAAGVVRLTSHFNLVLMLGMPGAIHPLSHMPS